MQEEKNYIAGLYLRLSKEDENDGESTSIGTQRGILLDFCKQRGYEVFDTYIDDGYSGMNFLRPGFNRLLEDIEQGHINMVITKDLSRLGRDYIMTGYYSEIFFQNRGVRYIAIADNFDSITGDNEIAPFKNILNEMYARDISKKIKHAKHLRAKQGQFVGAEAPYGYQRDPNIKGHLIVDPEAAETVRLIFSLAQLGYSGVSIANELKRRQILTPSAYKYQIGRKRFATYSTVANNEPYSWQATTVNHILHNQVYTGTLASLKTEVINCKTKRKTRNPEERQIISHNAHEAIISKELFDEVTALRSSYVCTANQHRFNLFRGKLYCECCGHPLNITKRTLQSGSTDMYLCMYHYQHPEICPKTHRIYHDMLYPYVLQQVRAFASSMKRRKVNSPISKYASVEELTPQVLSDVIERIEVSHVSRKAKPGSVIHIYWKLQ